MVYVRQLRLEGTFQAKDEALSWCGDAHLAVLFLGRMEWISTRYHILSSGQNSCMHRQSISSNS